MVDAGSHIGQMEIGAEGSTSDGSIEGSGSDGSRYGMDQHTNSLKTLLIGMGCSHCSANVKALDGVRLQTRHVRSAWSAGITTSVVHPLGSQLLAGFSGAFHTCQVGLSCAT